MSMIKPYKKCQKCGAWIISGKLCDDCKPKSNADRIRQMTDEELAKKLKCDSCIYQVMKSECESSECVDGILAWLRKEVSDDAEA